jgi:excisionase family DNA binding protein
MHQKDEASSLSSSVQSSVLTVSEAAKYLRISVWTLRHWMSASKIEFVKYNGDGRAVFREYDLDRFISKNVKRVKRVQNGGSSGTAGK